MDDVETSEVTELRVTQVPRAVWDRLCEAARVEVGAVTDAAVGRWAFLLAYRTIQGRDQKT